MTCGRGVFPNRRLKRSQLLTWKPLLPKMSVLFISTVVKKNKRVLSSKKAGHVYSLEKVS